MTTTIPTNQTARKSKRDQRFADRYGPWAVVTGASAGIGEAIVRSLAERGLNLVLVGRSRERIEQLASDLEVAHPIRGVALPLDLAARDSIAMTSWGRLWASMSACSSLRPVSGPRARSCPTRSPTRST